MGGGEDTQLWERGMIVIRKEEENRLLIIIIWGRLYVLSSPAHPVQQIHLARTMSANRFLPLIIIIIIIIYQMKVFFCNAPEMLHDCLSVHLLQFASTSPYIRYSAPKKTPPSPSVYQLPKKSASLVRGLSARTPSVGIKTEIQQNKSFIGRRCRRAVGSSLRFAPIVKSCYSKRPVVVRYVPFDSLHPCLTWTWTKLIIRPISPYQSAQQSSSTATTTSNRLNRVALDSAGGRRPETCACGLRVLERVGIRQISLVVLSFHFVRPCGAVASPLSGRHRASEWGINCVQAICIQVCTPHGTFTRILLADGTPPIGLRFRLNAAGLQSLLRLLYHSSSTWLEKQNGYIVDLNMWVI